MARPEDEDAPWARQLLVGTGVLLAVALVIGGVVSVFALGAARVTGIDSASSGRSNPPTLVIPSDVPTTTPEPFPDPDVPQAAGSSSQASSPSATPTKKKKPPTSISLQAFPQRVSANQRINLTGTYRGGEGARLQVQRFQGSWTNFPVTVSVSGGLFNTYVYTGRSGPQRFRVMDTTSGRKSNPVKVSVGG
ncbi:MAG: hypothetical protein HOQ45_14245 [Nocardioidaceae bacterium]|nr:hypothetical protein [Nocardioidaceae bacterium]